MILVYSLLGRYENFPGAIHGMVRIAYNASKGNVQKAVVSAFAQLSQRGCGFKEIAHSIPPTCEVLFEFGIGEDATFTFMDNDLKEKLVTEIERKPLVFLDFLCVLKYCRVDESGKRTPLKFDYYMLRLLFAKRSLDFLIFHERGPRRVHVQDLLDFLKNRIENEIVEDSPKVF